MQPKIYDFPPIWWNYSRILRYSTCTCCIWRNTGIICTLVMSVTKKEAFNIHPSDMVNPTRPTTSVRLRVRNTSFVAVPPAVCSLGPTELIGSIESSQLSPRSTSLCHAHCSIALIQVWLVQNSILWSVSR